MLGAAALVATTGVALPPAAASQHEQGDVQEEGAHCTTRLLTLEEIRAGARSEVRCFATFAEAMADSGIAVDVNQPLSLQREAALQSSSLVGIHYDGASATGGSISITGSSCNGGGISFSAGDAWNDRISSTEHRLCGTIKHWVDANYQGSQQNTQGSSGIVRNLNGTLSNAVSSIRYYA